ncbi:Hypothetical protein FKW44_022625 [Caligus rogercresseyi]|uniref:Uncharacterized protein n=1 Tax=Caligus rogercresseyi TaxID=217165 RepID=A0A7T8JTL0_CALRO|nr:Hypothetical protein FKW44_022625 [Caligus rogercresseyi]
MVKPSIIRSVMLSLPARYATLSLKILYNTEYSWFHSGNVIKFTVQIQKNN